MADYWGSKGYTTRELRCCGVPGERAFVICVRGVGPAAMPVLVAFDSLLPQRGGNVAGRFVFRGQELVKLAAGFGCDDQRPAVTEIVPVGHPEDRVGLGVAATTWTIK